MGFDPVNAVRDEVTKTPDVGFEKLADSMGGTPMSEYMAKAQKEQQAEAPAAPPAEAASAPAPQAGGPQPNAKDTGLPADPAQAAIDAANPKDLPKAVGQGLALMTQNALNTGLDVAHHIIDFGSQLGLSHTDLVTPNRIDWASKMESPNDSVMVRAVRGITQYAAPMLATMGAGTALGVGKALSGVVAGSLVNTAISDPHQERISSMILDNVPEIKNYPIAYHVAQALSNKPGETDNEGRINNLAESLLVGAGLGAAAKMGVGMLRVFSAAKSAMAFEPAYVATAKAAAAKAPAAAAPIASEAELAAGELKMGLNAEKPPAPEALTNTNQTIDHGSGPTVNLNNDDVMEFVRNYVSENPKSREQMFPAKISGGDVSDQADAIIRSPEKFSEVLGWKPGDKLTQQHVAVFDKISQQSIDNMTTAAMRYVQTGDADHLAHLSLAIDTHDYIHETKITAGTQAGQTLAAFNSNPFKLSAEMSGMSHQDFLDLLTADGKKQILQGMRDAAGGDVVLGDIAHQLVAVAQMGPDEVGKAMGKLLASKQGTGIKLGNMLQAIAINGMLSRPSTVVGNMISNLGTTVHSVANNYTAVGIGQLRPHIDNVGELLYHRLGLNYIRSAPEALTLADANSYMKGLLGGVGEGFYSAGKAIGITPEGIDNVGEALYKAAGKSYIRGEPVPAHWGQANTIKGDLVKPMNAISTDAMGGNITISQRMLGALVNKYGLAPESEILQGAAKKLDGLASGTLNMTGAVISAPSRLNATADSFFGTIMYRAKLRQLADMHARDLGLGAGDVAKFSEDIMKDVPEAWHREALDFAQTNTFSKALDPESFSGKLAGVDSWFDKHPLVKVVAGMPFFKTNMNIVKYAFESSPLAYIAPTNVRNTIIRGGVEGDLAAAKVVTGTAFLGMAAGLAAMGTITGDDTSNPRVKQALAESGLGWIPHAFHIAGNYYAYNRIDPFASLLDAGSFFSKLRNDVTEEEYQHAASIGGGALMEFMTADKILEGFTRNMDAYQEAVRTGLGPKGSQVLANTAAMFIPYGGLQADLQKYTDKYKRDQSVTPGQGFFDQTMDMLKNHYKASSPWYSQDMPVTRNFLGEPQLNPDGLGPDLISPVGASRGGNTELVDKLRAIANYYGEKRPQDASLPELNIQLPGKVWGPDRNGPKIPLSPAEHERLIMYSAGLDPRFHDGRSLGGPTLRQALEEDMKALKNVGTNMTAAQYKAYLGIISGTISTYRNMGNQYMAQREAEVMGRWTKVNDSMNKDYKQINAFQTGSGGR